MKQNFMTWKRLSLSILQKMRKYVCWEENTKGVATRPFNKEIMGLYEQTLCQFELKETETRGNEEGLLNLFHSTGQGNTAIL